MSTALPRFCAGERVSIVRSRMPSSAGGSYSIVRALPASRDEPIRYRVRGDTEPFDRIVDEVRLQSLTQENLNREHHA